MGDYKHSVNWHYSKGNISALVQIANDKTIDDDDRELAEKYIKELKKRENEKDSSQRVQDDEER